MKNLITLFWKKPNSFSKLFLLEDEYSAAIHNQYFMESGILNEIVENGKMFISIKLDEIK